MLSEVLASGMITGPLDPAAASCICAAVPAMPEVVTLPLTDLSEPTIMVPLPDAEVVTGGTSCAPLNVTFVPDISAAPANAKTAAATIAVDNLPQILATLFIFCAPLVRN